MAFKGCIGEVVEHRMGNFEWIIHGFRFLTETGSIFDSPEFRLGPTSWSFRLNTKTWNWMNLQLYRRDCGTPKVINCTIGVKKATGSRVTIATSTAKVGTDNIMMYDNSLSFVIRTERVKSQNEYLFTVDTLTICCQMSLVDETPSKPRRQKFLRKLKTRDCGTMTEKETDTKGKALISREVQTEDLFSRTKKKNNTRHKDYANSKAAKGWITEKSVKPVVLPVNYYSSSHVGKTFMTREIQTEDIIIVNEEKTDNTIAENSVDSDAEGVTLLQQHMKELLTKGDDFDVKICVKNKQFQAHGNILKSRSPVFAMMLTHDTAESNSGSIDVQDCDPESFGEFLTYVYSGKTENLTPRKALNLYYTADKYDFPALRTRCATFLRTSLSPTIVADVILLAALHGEKELLEEGIDFFARNMNEILPTVEWQRFLSGHPTEANEVLMKSMKVLVPKN